MAIQNLAPKISYFGPLHPYPRSYKCSVESDQKKVQWAYFMSFLSYFLHSQSTTFYSHVLSMSHFSSLPTSCSKPLPPSLPSTLPPFLPPSLPPSYPPSLPSTLLLPSLFLNPLNCRLRVPSVRGSGPILLSVTQCS